MNLLQWFLNMPSLWCSSRSRMKARGYVWGGIQFSFQWVLMRGLSGWRGGWWRGLWFCQGGRGEAVQGAMSASWQPGGQSCPAVCWASPKGSADGSRLSERCHRWVGCLLNAEEFSSGTHLFPLDREVLLNRRTWCCSPSSQSSLHRCCLGNAELYGVFTLWNLLPNV